jgi:hypothetical protein
MPENRIETFGSKPMRRGARTVAPNMATTCCSPTTTVAPAGSRSSGMTTPSVLRLQRGKKLFSAGMIVPFMAPGAA